MPIFGEVPLDHILMEEVEEPMKEIKALSDDKKQALCRLATRTS